MSALAETLRVKANLQQAPEPKKAGTSDAVTFHNIKQDAEEMVTRGHESELVSALAEQSRALTAMLTAQAQAQPIKNGKGTWLAGIVAASIFGVSSLVASVSWANQAESRLSERILTLTLKVDNQEKLIMEVRSENATLRTWNEKVRNNFAAMGWDIDPISGEIKRYERRRR